MFPVRLAGAWHRPMLADFPFLIRVASKSPLPEAIPVARGAIRVLGSVPAAISRDTPAGQTAKRSDEASFARRKARQPGTCATLNPWSRSGPLKSYLRNKARYRS